MPFGSFLDIYRAIEYTAAICLQVGHIGDLKGPREHIYYIVIHYTNAG